MADHCAPFDLTRFTPYRLSVAAERVSDGLARQYRQRFGISVAEWRVLAHLYHSGGVSVRDIEARVAMEKSKVSRAAARLEAAGHVAKQTDPRDRRLVQLVLTEAGQALMRDLLPLATGYQAALEARLGPAFAAFEAALQTLLDEENPHDPTA